MAVRHPSFRFPGNRRVEGLVRPALVAETVLGESMGAASAFQVVAAVEALKSGKFRQAVVSAVGSNQQAAGILLGS